ncbi:MAG: heavy metal translocating P-type ATPase, partial [Eubacterium sp.]|nr:heavy metal translocating P-type ATPase [Eubacterium sp.]
MKFCLKHETSGRMRLHVGQKKMSFEQADILEYFLSELPGVTGVKVYDRTCDVVIHFTKNRNEILRQLQSFHYEDIEVPDGLLEHSGRAINAEFQDKLFWRIVFRYTKKLLLPLSLRPIFCGVKSVKFLKMALKSLNKGKLEVSVLDATAIGVSLLRGDYKTASSVMFLLNMGEILEEWTHKKSVDDLARSMSLQVKKVWVKTPQGEVLVKSKEVKEGDEVVVHMGTIVPFDGVVLSGEGMVNQVSLTGEALPVHKRPGDYIYAGSVLEEGDLSFDVKKSGKSSRYEKVVAMIEESEKLKSGLESRAEHLADSLVPWTLGGTALVYLLTRNVTKTLSVLMVDFSCALKMATPITVLYAI